MCKLFLFISALQMSFAAGMTRIAARDPIVNQLRISVGAEIVGLTL